MFVTLSPGKKRNVWFGVVTAFQFETFCFYTKSFFFFFFFFFVKQSQLFFVFTAGWEQKISLKLPPLCVCNYILLVYCTVEHTMRFRSSCFFDVREYYFRVFAIFIKILALLTKKFYLGSFFSHLLKTQNANKT